LCQVEIYNQKLVVDNLVVDMQVNTFDVIERRKSINVFKLGKLWVFKQFFDNHELFNALLDYYNKDLFRSNSSTSARGIMPSSS
jgi:hypothetical protein